MKNIIVSFFAIFFFILNTSLAMKITACAKIEGILILLSDKSIPNERDIPEVLKVPYLAKIKIKRIIPSKENYDVHEFDNYLSKPVLISVITFRDPLLKKKIKEGDSFTGYLYLNSLEYHHYGYKTEFSLEIQDRGK